MRNFRQRIGQWGENSAVNYLSTCGYTILECNVHTPHGEIDIVARQEELLIFVEVKTRTSSSFAYPEESITLRKQFHMLSAAEHYLREHPDSCDTWQFDVISVEGKPNGNPVITHFENVIG